MGAGADEHGSVGDPLERPVFIVGPPRAGGRLLARALATIPGTWTVPGGIAHLLSTVPGLDPPDGWREGRLLASDCAPDVKQRLHAELRFCAPRNSGPGSQRLIMASPRNALIVPFLRASFSGAIFVYVHRRAEDALAESLAIWRSGRARTYPTLPGWTGAPWSFLLVPGWQDLIGLPLAEVVTEQWTRTMKTMAVDLEDLPATNWCVTDYEALVVEPVRELTRLCAFLRLSAPLPADLLVLVRAAHLRLAASDVESARAELDPYLGRTADLAVWVGDWVAAREGSTQGT